MEKLKEKLKYAFGSFAISMVVAVYGIYMVYGPGGDGMIFGGVVGSIGLICGGIAGFQYAVKKVGE